MYNYLRKDELVIGRRYKVVAKNFDEATWDGRQFWGMRTRKGQRYEYSELHVDDAGRMGTCQPLERIS